MACPPTARPVQQSASELWNRVPELVRAAGSRPGARVQSSCPGADGILARRRAGLRRNGNAGSRFNPDFGQTDVDRQVVNLTRFSVFFPERRQFFLENRGIFFTGNGSRFELFFSRRIGLDEAGEPTPINAEGTPDDALGA
jgi:hypothetical protein